MTDDIQPMVGKRCIITGMDNDADMNGLHGTVLDLHIGPDNTPVHSIKLDRQPGGEPTYVPTKYVAEAPDYHNRICRQCGVVAPELVICLTCMSADEDDVPKCWMAYCSETCRKKHWPQHKKECNLILAYSWMLFSQPDDHISLVPVLEHADGLSERDWPRREDTPVHPHSAVPWSTHRRHGHGGGQRSHDAHCQDCSCETYPRQSLDKRQTWWQMRRARSDL